MRRGALPGRKPETLASATNSLIFSLKRSSMSLRSTVTLMCFLHGPMSRISTCCWSLTGASTVAVVSPCSCSAVLGEVFSSVMMSYLLGVPRGAPSAPFLAARLMYSRRRRTRKKSSAPVFVVIQYLNQPAVPARDRKHLLQTLRKGKRGICHATLRCHPAGRRQIVALP